MKFADPQKVACPSCGGEALHSVATLLTLEARCPICHRSLREVGERMNGEIRRAKTYTIAIGIWFAIEQLDSRIKFSDEGFEEILCLNDMIAVVDRMAADLPLKERPLVAEDLVYAAVKEALPSIKRPPGDLPLIDAFGNHLEEWFRRKKKLGQIEVPETKSG